MGIAPSKDNEELVDTLVRSGHLISPQIELVFRLVDRGDFVPKKYKTEIFADQPFKVPESDAASWSPGFLHISAPCMYACVLERLEIKKGDSFLNVGSGSGWLNTACGFLVGESGINHGVEIHSNLVEYAENIIEENTQTRTKLSDAIAAFDWGKPKFMHGNGLLMKHCAEFEGYDRIYCGASIREPSTAFRLTRLLKIGGRMIAPFQTVLFSFTRVSHTTVRTENIITCQFADLILPEARTPLCVYFSCFKPSNLKLICRYYIREELRKKASSQNDFIVSLDLTEQHGAPLAWKAEEFLHTSLRTQTEGLVNPPPQAEPRLHAFLAVNELPGRPFSAFFRVGDNADRIAGSEDHELPMEEEEQKSIYIEYPIGNESTQNNRTYRHETLLDNIFGFAARHLAPAQQRELTERVAEAEARNVVRQITRVTNGRVTLDPPADGHVNLLDGRPHRFRFIQSGGQSDVFGLLDVHPFELELNPVTHREMTLRRTAEQANLSDDSDERTSLPKRGRWENTAADEEISSEASGSDKEKADTTEDKCEDTTEEERFCDCLSEIDEKGNEEEKEDDEDEKRIKKKKRRVIRHTKVPINRMREYGNRFHELLNALHVPNHLRSFIRLEK